MTVLLIHIVTAALLLAVFIGIKKFRKAQWRPFDAIYILFLFLATPYIIGLTFISFGMIRGSIEEVAYSQTEEFDSKKWSSSKMYRYSVLNHVVNNVAKPGLSKNEVEKIFGKPDSIDKNNVWQYDCVRPGWRLIDFSGGGLSLEFSSNILLKSYNSTWVD